MSKQEVTKRKQPESLKHLTLLQKKQLRENKVRENIIKDIKKNNPEFKNLKAEDLTDMQFRYLEKGIRYQGVFDIETSDFDPNEKFIICYVMRIRDILTGEEQEVADKITKADIQSAVDNQNFHFDKRLLETLSHNLKYCDHVVGHFSSKFDMPYFRSRCLLTKQPELIPEYGSIRFGDTWRMMKTSMKAKRNTLVNFISQTTGNNEKTFVELKYWYSIYFPASKRWQKSMDYIFDHCVKDVKMTLEGLKVAEKFNSIGMQLT